MSNYLSSIPALILAGGLGSRLRTVLADRPKALAPVNGKPFIQFVIEKLKAQGARKVIFCIGYLGHMIRDCFGDGAQLGLEIQYSEEGNELVGTGGAIRKALTHVSERALILNGDTYLDIDYNNLILEHLSGLIDHKSKATLTLSYLDDHRRFGTVTFETNTKRVTGFLEKAGMNTVPKSGWLNAGVYVLEKQLIQSIATGIPVSLEKEVFPKSLDQGDFLKAHLCIKPFYDIGTPEDWRRFEEVESNQLNK
jgi:NDP-sugar pyrophosphorylase family protein